MGVPCGGCEKSGCRLCELAKTNNGYRQLWGLPLLAEIPPVSPPPPPPGADPGDPCRHRGDGPLQVPTAAALGLPQPTRTWYACGHPRLPLYSTVVRDGIGYVCPCTGCGPACPGYNEDVAAGGTGAARVILHNGAGGIGDGVQGLLAVTAVKHARPGVHVEYRPGPRAVPFVSLFRGYDSLGEPGDPVPADAEFRELNDGYDVELNTKCAEPRVARYCRNAGVRLPRLPTLRRTMWTWNAGAAVRGAVVFCPFSYGSNREYSIPGLLAVEQLLRAAGHRTLVVHNEGDRAWLLASEQIVGADPERVTAVLLNAAVVIGVDTGLTHLAAALGTPAVVLEGPTRIAGVFHGYPHVTPIAGAFPCSGCHWCGPWTSDHCSPRCPSLQGVDPARIAAAAEAAALLPPAGLARTVMSPRKLAVLRDYVRETAWLTGDMAELGVAGGGSALLISKFGRGRPLHLFDTFSGLPADCPDEVHRAGEFAAAEADVRAVLAGRNVVVHRGVFPAVLPAGDVKFRFVHVDGDLYRTTADAIAYFGPRMVRGGVMLFDDYRWGHTPGVARAVDEAFGARAVAVGDHQAAVKF